MLTKKILVGFAAFTLCSFAFASGDTFVQPPATPTFAPGVYLGLQAGYGMTGWDNASSGIDVSGENNFAGRVFIGYDFHPNFAIEAGYTQFFNNTKLKSMGVEFSNPKYNYAIDLVGKVKAHIYENFGMYGKAGVDYMYTNEGLLDKDKHDAFNVVYGAGFFYDVMPNLTMDVSWTRYNGDADWGKDYIPAADFFALGGYWKFNLS